MDRKGLSIATITWARDESEEKLLRASLQQLAKLNIPVYITDGGSDERFLSFLRSFPQFHLLNTKVKGVYPQVKSSLQAAFQSGSDFILYTEPDKYDFFARYLRGMLHEAAPGEGVGVILASRSEEGFETFPPFQQMTETTINNCCAEITGKLLDYTYGPFLVKRQLVSWLDLVQEDIGWGWRPYLFGVAARTGYHIEAIVNNFSCPPDQQQDNSSERLYRMRQLTQNIQGILLSANIPLPEER